MFLGGSVFKMDIEHKREKSPSDISFSFAGWTEGGNVEWICI